MTEPFVSILMLVHNAPDYAELAVRSVRSRTEGVRFELVVVDNASEEITRALLRSLHEEGLIDRLELLDRNTLFAEGNNRAAALASPDATHFLLLNSDVQVRSRRWLRRLLDRHRPGMTAYGVALDPLRVDGYCLLVDSELYREHPLDESHQWWWAVTKQQAALMTEGWSVQGWAAHEAHLHHFGGRSGSAFLGARGMDVTREEVESWFGGNRAVVLDRRRSGRIPRHEQPPVVRRARGLVRRIRRMVSA